MLECDHPWQVDVIVEELLRENMALMDRVSTLADEREVWRQTAESAALPGQGYDGTTVFQRPSKLMVASLLHW